MMEEEIETKEEQKETEYYAPPVEEDPPAPAGQENAEGESGKEAGKPEEPEIPVRRLPLASKILFIAAGVSLAAFLVCCFSESFADFFCRWIAAGPRALMAWITGWIPFSLAEAFVICLIPAAVWIVVIGIKRYADSWRNMGVFILILLSGLSVFFTFYVFSLGTGYRGSTIDQKLELDRKDVSAEELKATAVLVAEKVNGEVGNIKYGADGFSVMPYGIEGMTDALLRAYDDACEDYGFIQKLHSSLKTVMLSEPWTYTHITGMYSYFTGEANLNVNMPDYTIPYTGAHELAHQRGIAREDEANLVAYLVGIRSDDAYVRYSVQLNMLEYLLNALYSADSDAYREVYYSLDKKVRDELSAYSAFFAKYRQTVVSKVSNAVNDTYLKLNGTAGTKSYGMVVDLCVAYYKTVEGTD